MIEFVKGREIVCVVIAVLSELVNSDSVLLFRDSIEMHSFIPQKRNKTGWFLARGSPFRSAWSVRARIVFRTIAIELKII